MIQAAYIKSAASRIGFDLCGIASCRNLYAGREHFREWLDRGFDGGLTYLSRNMDKRFSPAELMPGAKTVVVCGVSYKNDTSTGFLDQHTPKIASYARCRDYHLTIKEMLTELAAATRGQYGKVGLRTFTDTAPVAEKLWAREAGLGWIGRNSLLINPNYGSFLLLGELFLDEQVDIYDEPYNGTGCGECRCCVRSCPNNAITTEGIDTRKCISRATIERPDQDAAPLELHGWIFGCDECQGVCPYNLAAPAAGNPRFATLFDPREIAAAEWLSMQDPEFTRRFGETPLLRTGLERLKGNVER